MANVAHSTIADAYKHEPKGVSAAEDGSVYIANGSGSGSWGKPFNLVADKQETAAAAGTTYELVTGLSGYTSLWVVVPMFYGPDDEQFILQIDNSGTYRTTGYEGGSSKSIDSTVDNISEGFPLWVGRTTGRDYHHGVFRLDNCNGGVVTCSGFSGTGDYNFLSTTGTSTEDAMDVSFGRQTNSSTVTKLRITTVAGVTMDSGYRYVQVYGIR